ncbi:hypothetical protein [Kibdelosporangium philippinense]|uniref:hypothetical protein n=1 Tax=Kibdelosporangium philippinense TaxID=211113 RepID=UPI00361750DF
MPLGRTRGSSSRPTRLDLEASRRAGLSVTPGRQGRGCHRTVSGLAPPWRVSTVPSR